MPVFTPAAVETIAAPMQTTALAAPAPKADEEFDSNPLFSLFAPTTTTPAPLPLDTASLIAAIVPAKAFLNFELVDAAEAERESERNLVRVQRLGVGLDALLGRLEGLIGE
jgi:hypothetical protein